MLLLTFEGRIDVAYVVAAHRRAENAVCVRREGGVEFGVVIWHFINWLYFIEIKWKFAGDAAIDARLQVGRPILADHIFAATIVLADACDAWVDRLAAIDVLNGVFAEKEVHIFVHIEGANEIGFCMREERNIWCESL